MFWVGRERGDSNDTLDWYEFQPHSITKHGANWNGARGRHSLYSTVQLWLLWRRRTMTTTIRHKQKKKKKKRQTQKHLRVESTFYFFIVWGGYCCLDLEMSDEKEREEKLKNNKSARNLLIEKRRKKFVFFFFVSWERERFMTQGRAVDKAPTPKSSSCPPPSCYTCRSLIWIVKKLKQKKKKNLWGKRLEWKRVEQSFDLLYVHYIPKSI